MKVLAIIPAAGTGVRMGGGTPKQFLSLEGVPIFIHTLRKFAASNVIDGIFLALRPEEMERARKDIDRERFSKPVRLVAGGTSRQETVGHALAEAPATTEMVVVHDAVRPFVELDLIQRVVEAARQHGAAVLGIPSVDTVKQVERQIIRGTIPRERIVLAQTPQAFRFNLIREAFARAEADGGSGVLIGENEIVGGEGCAVVPYQVRPEQVVRLHLSVGEDDPALGPRESAAQDGIDGRSSA